MSSREIAEYTGKEHFHVKRDIENMMVELKEDVSKSGCIYLDKMNRKQTEYLLDRDHTDCLLTGYSAKARMSVIKAWRSLESGKYLGDIQLPENYICGDSELIAEYGATAIAGLPDTDERNKICHLGNGFVLKKFTISHSGSTFMKTPAWILDLAKVGYRKILLVTNESNPHIDRTAEYVEDMRKWTNGYMKICLMTDKSAAKSIKLSPRAALGSPKND